MVSGYFFTFGEANYNALPCRSKTSHERSTAPNIRANILTKQEKIKAIIVSLTSDINLTLDEFSIIAELISSLVSDATIVLIGLKIESGLGNVIKISMATAY